MKTIARNFLQVIGMALVYFAAGKLGLAMAYQYTLAAPLWPPTGIALAAVLLVGYRIWPGIFLGAFLVNFVTLTGLGIAPAKSVAISVFIGIGNTLEALTGAWLVNRYAEGRNAFRQPKTVFRFAALTGVLSTAVSATIGLATSILAGLVAKGSAGEFWLTWWLGDMIGALLVAPCLLVWSVKQWPRLNPKRLAEGAALLLGLVVTCLVTFDGWLFGWTHGAPLTFLTIPLVLWSAFRFGLRGTAVTTVVAGVLATLGTLHNYGPFATGNPQASLLLLQNYIAVLTVLSLVLAADVIQRQRIAASMASSEERYRQLFDAIPLPVWVHDYDSLRFMAVNQAALDHYGYSREEFLKMTINDIRPAEDVPAVLEFMAQARAGLPVCGEWRHRKKDGSLIQVEVARRNLSFGKHPAALVLSTDITARKAAEEEVARLNRELRRHLEELETVFNAAPVGIAVARDPDCHLVRGNPTCAAMLGINGADHVLGNGSGGSASAKILQQGKEVPTDALPMQSAARSGARIKGEELDFVFPDGRVLNAYVSASPLYDEAGRVRGSLGIFVDLTQRRQTEAALRQRDEEVLRLNAELERRVCERTAQLEAINRELEAFSYSVSHDLRAPLRSIRGFSEVLLQRYASNLDERGQEFLKRTCESSQQMDRLIEDLLQLSRVGRAELQRRPVDLSNLAAGIAAELRQAEPQRPVEFIVAPDLKAQGDERLLRVVLENLLRNAWKFTAKQPAARVEFGFNHERPAFFVRDNGAGFDMAYADKLFGVFQRLHSAAEFPGTGVGLATVQRIINRHGGFTWAEGVPGQGATFYFSLPSQEASNEVRL